MSIKRSAVAAALLALASVRAQAQQPAAAPRADSVYAAGEVSVPPRALNPSEFGAALHAAIPPAFRAAGTAGTVNVSFIIGADGVPRALSVTGTTDSVLNPAALAAAAVLRFAPAQLDGRAVSARAELPVTWQPPADLSAREMARRYTADEVDREPVLLTGRLLSTRLARDYPPALRDAGIQGQVIVRALLNPQGIPEEVVVQSSVDPGFNAVSIAAVRALRFRPGEIGGTPVWVWVELPINWSVQ